MLTLQGCTSLYMFPPLSVCTRHVLGRLQVKGDVGVDHDLTNHTILVQVYRLFGFHPPGDPARVSLKAPNNVYRVPQYQTGARHTRPRAYHITAHPSGQRCARPPAYYKHQKLLATPGQRTRVNKKSSGVIFQGLMHGSRYILNHTYRSQCLRSASMKQPTMYSYMASCRCT